MSGKHGRHRRGHADLETFSDADEPAGGGGGRTATLERPLDDPDLSVDFDGARVDDLAVFDADDLSAGAGPDPDADQTPHPHAEPARGMTPTPTAAPDKIVPAGRGGSRRAARQELASKRRKQGLIGVAIAVALGLLVWAVFPDSSKPKPVAPTAPVAAPAGRTQVTMLVQVTDATGEGVGSALVAHDPATSRGVVLLVPADLLAPVPGAGKMPFAQAAAISQPGASQAALSDLLGVTIDGSWTLTPQGLQALVDKLGGISVAVDTEITKPGPNGTTIIVAQPGRQNLDGAAAATFATFHKAGEVEQARLARFDAVLSAVLAKLPKQQSTVTQVLAGLGAGSTSSFAGSRVAGVLTGLAADAARGATTDTMLPVTKLAAGDPPTYALDREAAATIVHDDFAPSVPANAKATGNKVMVENQVGTPGIGETTRQELIAAGFAYVAGQNAPGMPNATAPSVVLIQGTSVADISAGNKVARALGLPTSDVMVSQQPTRLADIVVLLGADYKP